MTDSTGLPTTLDLGELRRLLARLESDHDAWARIAVAFTRTVGGEPHDAGLRFFSALPALLDEIDRLRGSGEPAPHYWSGDRGAATGGNVGLPGDRDAQIDAILNTMRRTGFRLNPSEATDLYHAGLRVGAESVGGLEAAVREWQEAMDAYQTLIAKGPVVPPDEPDFAPWTRLQAATEALHALALALGSEPK